MCDRRFLCGGFAFFRRRAIPFARRTTPAGDVTKLPLALPRRTQSKIASFFVFFRVFAFFFAFLFFFFAFLRAFFAFFRVFRRVFRVGFCFRRRVLRPIRVRRRFAKSGSRFGPFPVACGRSVTRSFRAVRRPRFESASRLRKWGPICGGVEASLGGEASADGRAARLRPIDAVRLRQWGPICAGVEASLGGEASADGRAARLRPIDAVRLRPTDVLRRGFGRLTCCGEAAAD